MYTSTNLSPHRSRTVSRSLRYGEMNDISVIMPLSANSLPTSPMRRMFSSRSSGENPRLELSPWRMLSPSSTCAILPRWKSACSRVYATVDWGLEGGVIGVRIRYCLDSCTRCRCAPVVDVVGKISEKLYDRASHLAGAGEPGEPQDASLLVHGLLPGGGVHGALVPLDVGGVADLVGVHVDGGGRGHGDADAPLEEGGGGGDGGEAAGGARGVGDLGGARGEAGELTNGAHRLFDVAWSWVSRPDGSGGGVPVCASVDRGGLLLPTLS